MINILNNKNIINYFSKNKSNFLIVILFAIIINILLKSEILYDFIWGSKELFGEFTNIGTSTEVSIKDLCDLIKEIIGKEINIVQDKRRVRPANSEVERLVCDNTKLISSTKWKQQYDLKEGLSLTVEWFKENLDRYKSKNYNI